MSILTQLLAGRYCIDRVERTAHPLSASPDRLKGSRFLCPLSQTPIILPQDGHAMQAL
ncbi:MAG TPA: hypothetical protein VKV18_02005 [Chthonomonas sp.]|uniref:hypothetical protein n=1 Tax=Chthonomonas sp. TaxID=2282153 RepID=UPI002B4AF700|nr:hypothetical protein [Chthonomonas sp.]HLI47452.1 hypothetical protein [Chthonomonas sp.]